MVRKGPLTYDQSKWPELEEIPRVVSIGKEDDRPSWKLEQSKLFAVKSLYRFLNQGGAKCPYYKTLWKIAVPEKYKIFLWLAIRNRLHTNKVMAKKGWIVPDGSLV